MKQILTLLLALGSLKSNCQTTNPAPYCAPPSTNSVFNCRGGITNVTLGLMSNNTTFVGSYRYYDNILPAVLLRGRSYTLSLTFDTIKTSCRPSNSKYRVIIAWDNSVSGGATYFTSSADSVYNGDITTFDGSATKNITIKVPATAPIGTVRMRVIRYGLPSTGGMGITCGDMGFYGIGETEDYDISITDLTTSLNNYSKSDFVFYPNPATTSIIMNAGMPTKIFDMLGKEMHIIQSGNKIDISMLQNGMYVMQNALGTYRFVKY